MARRGIRVVAGDAGGLRLEVPPGARPTTDRVRESLFGMLAPMLDGASVLDLYAGSGALAIEALSRGAARALLVDDDPRAVDAARRNLTHTHLADRARVRHVRARTLLGGALPREAPFDLVCCDPPYSVPDDELTNVLTALAGPGWLREGARVAVERPGPGVLPLPPGAWRWTSERSYGDTLVGIAALDEQPRR